MKTIILTYDLSGQHSAVKKTLMEDYSWENYFEGENGKVGYPNTTLTKKVQDDFKVCDALEDIKAAAKKHGVTNSHRLVGVVTNMCGAIADPHS